MTESTFAPDTLPGSQQVEKETLDASQQGWSPNRSRRKIFAGVALVVVGFAIVLFAWGFPPFSSSSITTNNAYVRGRTIVVSPQVGGYLVDVPVVDFQRVRKGDLLARIDDRPFREKLMQGEASTAAQQANLANSQQSFRSAQAQQDLQDASVASAKAALQKAQADMNRIAELVGEGSVSLRERDGKTSSVFAKAGR